MRRPSLGNNASKSTSPSSSRKSESGHQNASEKVITKKITRSSSNVSSQSQIEPVAPTHSQAPISEIHAVWNGKLLVIHGLSQHQFPTNVPVSSFKQHNGRRQRGNNGRYFTGDQTSQSPAFQQRPGLKRKRSVLNGSSNSLNGHEDYDSNDSDGDDGGASPSKRAQRADGEDYSYGTGNSQSKVSTVKRRRRGANAVSQAASRAPSPPPLPILAPDEDVLSEADLPPAYLSREPTPDPNYPTIADPEDEAQAIYKESYIPLPKASAFINALTKFNPAQRSTENLYTLAANTALALQAWQNEYLIVDRLIAPHAAIPRKPATGARLPLDETVFEDMKEADLYDYVLDPKKPGRQDPIAQRVLRDASGRELRQRAPRGRVGADGLVAAAAAMAGEDEGGRTRARKPVSKYDGVAGVESNGTRKRGFGSETPDGETTQPAKRGRWSGGRGSRGGGRGGRGRGGASLLGKRIREMREQSAMTATTDEESGSETGSAVVRAEREYSASLAPDYDHLNTSTIPQSYESPYGNSYSLAEQLQSRGEYHGTALETETERAAAAAAAQKRKGRPKGSKNLHKRSDAGIPKGPRVPKPSTAGEGISATGSPAAESGGASPGGAVAAATSSGPKIKAPKSDKRSQSMTDWWAKRKAAEAEKRIQEVKDSGGSVPTVSSSSTGAPLPSSLQQQQQQGPYQQLQYPYATTGAPMQMASGLPGSQGHQTQGMGSSTAGYAPTQHQHYYATAALPPGSSGSGGYNSGQGHGHGHGQGHGQGISFQQAGGMQLQHQHQHQNQHQHQHQHQMQVLGPDGRAMQLVDPEGRPMRVLGTSADGSSMQVVGPDGRTVTVQVQMGPLPPPSQQQMGEYGIAQGQGQGQGKQAQQGQQGQQYMSDLSSDAAAVDRDRRVKDANGFARSF